MAPMKKRREQRGLFTQRGVAVILVTIALVLMAHLGFEFSTRTTTDVMSAVNARDDMRAHFLARSGANLAQLMIRVQAEVLDRNRKVLGDIQIGDFAGYIMAAFGGSADEVKDLAANFGGFEGEKIKGMGADVGTFEVGMTYEDGKINMNCANGSNRSKQALQGQLEALMYNNAYDELFQAPDADGWRRDRKEQVNALIDYVDRDRTRFDAPGTPEAYGYQSLDDRYEAKNNYLDSVDELKLVRGVDDRFWTLFGNQFTVYGDCRINIGSVRDPRLLAAVIFLSAKNPDDPVLKDTTGVKLLALAQQVMQAQSLGI